MKVKALIKAAKKSKKVEFGEKYSDKDVIIIDGCFVPMSKASEDKRKVDSFYVEVSDNTTSLCINTVYIKEEAAHSIEHEKVEKIKKKDKDIQKKIRKEEEKCQKLEKKLAKAKKKISKRANPSHQE